MLLYRVFPHDPGAATDQPGHPLYVHPDQGFGRWDNSDLYLGTYLADSPDGAIGEAFAHLARWSPAMLPFPTIPNAHRTLGTYRMDEEVVSLLNLDDARVLLDLALRPTDVVIRNRPRTQEIARQIFAEGRWGGLSWWSMHRPQWTLHLLWETASLTLERVEPLTGHTAVAAAARLMGKELDPQLVASS